MPTPTPTEAQIASVRKITEENSYSLIAGLVAALNDAEWADALEDITAYPSDELEIATSDVKISNDAERARLRKDMRLRLGLAAFPDEERMSWPGSVVVGTCVRW